MTDQELAFKANWESRKEALSQLFKRVVEQYDKMEPYQAIAWSSALADVFIQAYQDAARKNGIDDANDLITSILNN